jgi:hypothetical protein
VPQKKNEYHKMGVTYSAIVKLELLEMLPQPLQQQAAARQFGRQPNASRKEPIRQ